MSTIKSSAENLTLNADGANNDIKFQSNGSEVASIDQAGLVTAASLNTTGNVGIGTTLPSQLLELSGATAPVIRLTDTTYDQYAEISTANAGSLILKADVGNGGTGSTYIGFEVDATERMRIDSSGNVLMGKTAASTSTVGVQVEPLGTISSVGSSRKTLILNRLDTNGEIAQFRKDGTTVGSIGNAAGGDTFDIRGVSNYFRSGTGNTALSCYTGLSAIFPYRFDTESNRDNGIDIGHSSARFDDIYATNGTIQTSDRNEKQDIEELSVAETAVATACKGLMRKFRWKDAVAEKGDDARIHFGIIAQDLQSAFTAEGLDASDYAMFISTAWWETQTEVPAVEAAAEVTDEDGNVTTEAEEAKDAYTRTDTFHTLEEAPEGATEKTRLGVRYPELLAFIISAL